MKAATALVALVASAASAAAHYNYTAYTTETVDVYTTYCPYATTVPVGSKTYTVTGPTTLTISECPCTITRPIYSSSSVICETCSVATGTGFPSSSPVPTTAPFVNATTIVSVPPVPIGTGTISVPPPHPPVSTGTAAPPASSTPVATSEAPIHSAGANRVIVAQGGAVAGLVGLVAYML